MPRKIATPSDKTQALTTGTQKKASKEAVRDAVHSDRGLLRQLEEDVDQEIDLSLSHAKRSVTHGMISPLLKQATQLL
jgi:hypothetical protein